MAYASMIDANELLWTDLTSIASGILNTATSGRIYGPPGLPLEWTPALGPTIMFLDGNFGGTWEHTTMEMSYRIHCYAINDVAVRSLFNKLYAALHRKGIRKYAITGGNGLVVSSAMAVGPYPMTDSETDWSYCWSSWQFKMSENFVP